MIFSYYNGGYRDFLPEPKIEEIMKIFEAVFASVDDDYELSSSLNDFKEIILFSLYDAKEYLVFDLTGDIPKLTRGKMANKPEIEISLKFKDFHLFWCYQINLLQAVTFKKIRFEGPMNKIMQLSSIVETIRNLYIKEYRALYPEK